MKLSKLHIENYGCFGNEGIDVAIDDIVVLIGRNDVGKSTILDAYEAFASVGSEIPADKYCSRRNHQPVTIEAEFSNVTDEDIDTLGANWVFDNTEGSRSIRVRWKWSNPGGKGIKESFRPNPEVPGTGEWVPGGVGGWDTLIQSRIPTPLRILPDTSAKTLESTICEILISAIKNHVRANAEDIEPLLEQIQALSNQFHEHVSDQIDQACAQVTERMARVFPGYTLGFEPNGGKFDPEKILGAGSYLKVDSPGNDSQSLANRGTGVQRSFLWSAISALTELGLVKKGKKLVDPARPRILLVDEPESFLHPPAIRRARDCLYTIAEIEEWQVMATTHSPIFIDVSKPHTAIVRVAKEGIESRIFQTDKAHFEEDERSRLQMVRACDPVLCEFFFADNAIIVEGETEHLAIANALQRHFPDIESSYSIINARGKANVCMFMKILNQFGTPYIVVHDSDKPKARRGNGTYIRNAMWTENRKICETLASRDPDLPQSRIHVHIPDFEGSIFNYSLRGDKPYALMQQMLRPDYANAADLQKLRDFGPNVVNGENAELHQYRTMAELIALVRNWTANQEDIDAELWNLDDPQGEPLPE